MSESVSVCVADIPAFAIVDLIEASRRYVETLTETYKEVISLWTDDIDTTSDATTIADCIKSVTEKIANLIERIQVASSQAIPAQQRGD